MRRYTDTITIDAECLWMWIRDNYLPKNDDEVYFGTPRYCKETGQFTVDYVGIFRPRQTKNIAVRMEACRAR